MAAARKRRKKKGTSRCKITVVCGVKRRICRDAKGRIKSSKAVGKKRGKKRKSTSKRKRACKYGKLKSPVGNRICKKAPKRRRRAA